jgi:hypothetical protein
VLLVGPLCNVNILIKMTQCGDNLMITKNNSNKLRHEHPSNNYCIFTLPTYANALRNYSAIGAALYVGSRWV